MPHIRFSSAEIEQRGQSMYDQFIRSGVEAQNRGKFLVLNIETGEYEIDRDKVTAFLRAAAKHTDPALYILRIGFPSSAVLGSNVVALQPS